MMYLVSPCEYAGFLKCWCKTKSYFFLRKPEFSPGFGTSFFPVFSGLCLQDHWRKPYWFTLFACSISLPSNQLVPKYWFSWGNKLSKTWVLGPWVLSALAHLSQLSSLISYPASCPHSAYSLWLQSEKLRRPGCCASTAQQQLKHCCYWCWLVTNLNLWAAIKKINSIPAKPLQDQKHN